LRRKTELPDRHEYVYLEFPKYCPAIGSRSVLLSACQGIKLSQKPLKAVRRSAALFP
jgi:hypothetical protein